ncbi:MAG: hypothetical protein IPO25_22815 [Saprospiraceae bacterium]|nr:hypothetical protein [Saprospiraceae bacterium]
MEVRRMQIRRQTRLYLMMRGGKIQVLIMQSMEMDQEHPEMAIPLTDEDSEDPAGLEVLDIALFKKLDGRHCLPAAIWVSRKYKINVENRGDD